MKSKYIIHKCGAGCLFCKHGRAGDFEAWMCMHPDRPTFYIEDVKKIPTDCPLRKEATLVMLVEDTQ